MNDNSISKNFLSSVYFNKSIHSKLNALVFFLTFTALTFLGSSITFYLFILLTILVGAFWKQNFAKKNLFIALLIVVVIASVFAPYSKFIDHPGFLKTFQMTIQYIYWILLSIFFITKSKRIDEIEISKWIFYGTICTIVGYYLLPFRLVSALGSISTSQSRNSFVFTLLCTIPLAFHYIQYRFSRNKQMLFIGLYFLALLLTNGRSGALVGMIEISLLLMVLFPAWNRLLRFFLIPLVLIFIAMQTDGMKLYMDQFADKVELVNPRFANLIRGEEEGDLTMDKSWLIRKLMIDKGYEIVEEYPFFGIGPNNFIFYDSKLSTFSQYERLQSESERFYNTRSAHNSYLQIMTEFGIIGLLLFLSILLFPLFYFFKKVIQNRLSTDHLALIALLGISIHFYAISSITGALPWMVIGLAWSAMYKLKDKQL